MEGLVLSLRGANARQVIEGIEQKLKEIQPALPKDVRISPFYKRSQLVNKATATIVHALVEASLLVVVLLLLFLGDLRAALTVALILPMVALFAFLLMYHFGITANLMRARHRHRQTGRSRRGGRGEHHPAPGRASR